MQVFAFYLFWLWVNNNYLVSAKKMRINPLCQDSIQTLPPFCAVLSNFDNDLFHIFLPYVTCIAFSSTFINLFKNNAIHRWKFATLCSFLAIHVPIKYRAHRMWGLDYPVTITAEIVNTRMNSSPRDISSVLAKKLF